MSNTQEYIFDFIDLITLPDIYICIKEAIDDPDTDLNELAELLKYDPAISSRLLKVANSAVYGQIAEVETVKKAVSILGTQTVHDLVLAVSVSYAYQSMDDTDYDVATFWRNSITRAAVAKACAIELDIKKPENMFIIGLLSDIGHMVMSIRSPDLMHSVLSQHKKTGFALHLFERSTFGFDYGELGADLLENWSIPRSIISGIRYQNCPEVAEEFQQEAAISYCAGRLHPNESDFPNMVDIETLRQAGIKQFDYDQVRTNAETYIEEALTLFPIRQLKEAV